MEHDLAFDINAEIEEVTDYDFKINYLQAGISELNEMTVDDQKAINACSAMRIVPNVLTEMRPTDNTIVSEYSYRTIDNIKQFWAGPSHWKFRRMSQDIVTPKKRSLSKSDAPLTCQTGKSTRKKNRLMPDFSNVFYDEDAVDDVFVTLDEIKMSKISCNTKNWDSDKLTLPNKLFVERSLFESFVFCPSISTEIKKMGPAKSNEAECEKENFDEKQMDDPFAADGDIIVIFS